MDIKKLRIGQRLALGFGTTLMLTIVMFGAAILQMNNINAAKEVMVVSNQRASLAHKWLEGISTNSVRTLAKIETTDAAHAARYTQEMKVVSDELTILQKQIETLRVDPESKRVLDAALERRKQYAATRDRVFKMKAELPAGDEAIPKIVENELLPALKAYVESARALVKHEEELFATSNHQIEDVYRRAITILAILAGLAVAIGTASGIALTRGVTRPLAEAVAIADRIQDDR